MMASTSRQVNEPGAPACSGGGPPVWWWGRHTHDRAFADRSRAPRGMPFALDLARTWLSGETTLFGMLDTIVRPRSAHQRLLAEHARAAADLTLGVFPTDEPSRFGMVNIDERGRVVGNVDKPASTSLRYMWGFACWSPAFGALMGDHLRAVSAAPSEVVLSSVFRRAVNSGFRVVVVTFDDGEYIDIGTASSAG